jgi:hypothetical protein
MEVLLTRFLKLVMLMVGMVVLLNTQAQTPACSTAHLPNIDFDVSMRTCAAPDAPIVFTLHDENVAVNRYLWEVSEGSNGPWTSIFIGKGPSSVSVTPAQLYKPGYSSKYGSTRYIRVTDKICDGRGTATTTNVNLLVPAPVFNATGLPPDCHFFTEDNNASGTNGKTQIQIVSYDSPAKDFLFDFYYGNVTPANFAGQRGRNLNTDAAQIFQFTADNLKANLPNTLAFRPAVYNVVMKNNDVWQCGSVKTFTVPNKAELPVRLSGGHNLNCFESSTEGTLIQLSVNNGVLLGTTQPWTYELQQVSSESDNIPDSRTVIAPTGYAISVNPSLNPEFRNLFHEGFYRVKVTDGNNCSGLSDDGNSLDNDVNVINIMRPNRMTIDAEVFSTNGYSIACRGENTNVKVTAIGGGFGNSSNNDFKATVYKGTSLFAGPSNLSGDGRNGASRTFFNLNVGDYTAYVQDDNGCVKSKSFTLNEPATAPSISVILNLKPNGYNLLCPEHSNGSGTISGTGGVGSLYQYKWKSLSDSYVNTLSTVGDLHAGDYRCTITDANGCLAGKTVTVTAPPSMVLQTSVTSNYGTLTSPRDVSCVGASDGSAKVEVTANPDPPYFYDWSNGDLSNEAQELLANQIYSVTVRNKTGCEVASSITLLPPPALLASAFVSTNFNGSDISCFGASDAALDVTLTNAVGPPSYSWTKDTSPSIISSEKTFSSVSAGRYLVTAVDDNNCEVSSSVTVKDPQQLTASISPLTDFNGEIISCSGSSDGALQAIASGGIGGYSYFWSDNSQTQVLTQRPAGNYSVQVTDANGCKANTSFNIFDPPLLEVNIKSTSNYHGQLISCAGQSDASFIADATGGTGDYSYLWNDNATTSGRSIQPAGDYEVTVSDENGCDAIAQISIPDPVPVSIDLISKSNYHGYEIRCNNELNGLIEISAEGGTGKFSYQWDDGPAENFWNALGAGSYRVTAEDENGCEATETYTLTEPQSLQLSVNSISDATCFGVADGSVTLNSSGGVGEKIYFHNYDLTLRTEKEFTGLSANVYSFTVTDANNCQATIDATVNEPAGITFEIKDIIPAYCNEARGSARAEVDGGSGNLQLSWKDEAGNKISNSDFISKVSAGVYVITAIDESNCTAEREVGITSVDGPAITQKEINNTLCFGSADGQASIDVGGNGPFIITWPDGSSDEKATNLKAGSYIVKVQDVNECLAVQEVLIGSPDPVVIDLLTLSDISCAGKCDGIIKINARGGNGDFIFKWSNNQTSSNLNELCAGSYNVLVTDTHECKATETYSIQTPAPLNLSLQSSSSESCFEQCDGKLKVVANGGVGAYTYEWSNDSSGNEITRLCKNDYTLVVTDENNCTVSETYSIGGPDKLALAKANEGPPTCKDGCDGYLSVLASGGNGGYKYMWDNETSGQERKRICPGTYSAKVTDKEGCTAEGEFILNNQDSVQVDMEDEVTLCEGQVYKLDAGSFASYKWTSNKGFTASTRIVDISEDGLYKVEVTTPKGCSGEAEFLLQTSSDLLEAQFITANEAHRGDTLVLIDVTWPVSDSIAWQTPQEMEIVGLKDGDLFGRFDHTGSYTVGMHAYLGLCYDYVEKTIEVLNTEDGENEGGRLGARQELIDFTLSPNPTTGIFNVEIELDKQQQIALAIINGGTGKILARISDDGKSRYSIPFNLAPLSSGVYMLRLDLASGTHYIRFIVK